VVKVIRQKTALPPKTDGSIVYARWRECALPYEHTGATWRIQLNSCFLRPTRVQNPNGNSISSAVFAQLTAQCRRVHWRHLANTIELVLSSVHPTPQPKWQRDRFSHFCTAHGKYFTMGPLFPKLPLSVGRSGPQSNT